MEKRVAANEKKITILKRIIKTQQNPFGGGPLEEINSILQDISTSLLNSQIATTFGTAGNEEFTENISIKMWFCFFYKII